MEEELKKKFDVLFGMNAMLSGMYEFSNSDYGRGVNAGIIMTLRALGIGDDFSAYVAEKMTEKKVNEHLHPDGK